MIENWSRFENKLIKKYCGMTYKQILLTIPDSEKRYKCHDCFLIMKHSDLNEGSCPICKNKYLIEMCPLDNTVFAKDVTEAMLICPLCNQPIDPITHNHDVICITRVTGYLQDFSGFNMGKQQETKDRVRNNLNSKGDMVRDRKEVS